MALVRVRLAPPKPGRYDIRIEAGLLDRLGETVAAVAKAPSAVVISDGNVGPLYGQRAIRSLSAAGLRAELLTFPAGEANKNLATVGRLWDALAGMTVERATPIVALGGGVVGDVAGFVAACYLRGLPVVQVPTTLLACVDSSVGGKTGVDHPVAGKNMIGAFHQPAAVLIDPLLLASLPQCEWSCGLAESVKHGAALDGRFFAWLRRRASELSDLAAHAAGRVEPLAGLVGELIRRNCRIKARIVSADEKEAGLRAVLNFGHTAGHTIETLSGFGRLRHGEAVSIGMVVETRIAVARGLAAAEFLRDLVELLRAVRLPVAVPAGIVAREVVALAAKDKKVRGGRIRFVLPVALGRTRIVDDVTAEELCDALEQSRAATSPKGDSARS